MNQTFHDEEAQICCLRARSNAAIMHLDVGQVVSVLNANETLLIGSGERFVGIAATEAYFQRSFKDLSFLMAVRKPEVVHINSSTAAEEGYWRAHWRPNVIRGRYMARWERGASGRMS